MPDSSHGLILRSDDGSIHFIRQEILDQTKVTEPEMAEFCSQLLSQGNTPKTAAVADADIDGGAGGGGGAGAPAPKADAPAEFALATGNAINTLAFQGPFQSAGLDLGENRVASSTVMCPGTMGLADFETVEI